MRSVWAEVARLSLHREQLLHVAHEPVACGLLLVDLIDERLGLWRLEHREPVADALVRLDRVEERMGSDTGVDAFEERDLLGVLDLACADRREGVHDGVPVRAGGRVPDELGLDVLKHLLRLAAFDPQIARAAAGLPCTIGVLRDERLYAGDALRLRRLRAHEPGRSEEHFVVEKLRMLDAELLPVVDLAVGEKPLLPHLAGARHHLALVDLVGFVAADGLHEEVVVGRGLLVGLGRLEIEAREPYLVAEERIGLVAASRLQDYRLDLLEELREAAAVFNVALVPEVGVELADLAEYGRRQRNAALDAPFKDEIRREVAAAVQDHPLDRPVFASADVLEGVFEHQLPHLRRPDALDVVEQQPHDEREQRTAPVVFRKLLEHHLGDLEDLGPALRVARAVHQCPPGRVELVRRGDRLRKTPEMLGRAAVEAEIPGCLLDRCVPGLLGAQIVCEPVAPQRLAAHLPRYLRRLEVEYRGDVAALLGKTLERGLGVERTPRGDRVRELAFG